jgi:hypothetical protein
MRSRIVCAAAIILGVSALARKRVVDFRSSGATLLLAAITVFVALYAVIDPSTGDRKTAEFSEALRWIAALAAFVGAANIRGPVSAFRTLRTTLLAIAFVSLIGVATFSNNNHSPMLAVGGFCDKQLLAAMLAMFVPAAVAMILLGRGKSRLLAGAVLLILLIGLALTFNRTSWISSSLGVVVVLSLLRGSTIWRSRVSIIFSRRTAIAAIIMLGLCVVAIENSRFSGSLSPRVALGSMLWRSHAASAAFSFSKSAPLVGNGPGSLGFELQSHGFLHVPQTLVAYLGLNAHAHNTYLEMAADLGWPATVAYCALLLVLIRNFLRGFRHCRSERQCIVLISGFGALIVYVVDSLANPAWQYAAISVPFWMLIGVGAGAITPRARATAFVRLGFPTVSPPRWAIGMAAAVMIGLCPLKSSGNYYGSWQYSGTGNWTDPTQQYWAYTPGDRPSYPNSPDVDVFISSGNVTLNTSVTVDSLMLGDGWDVAQFPVTFTYDGNATFTQSGGSSSLGTLEIAAGTDSTAFVGLTAGTLTASITTIGVGSGCLGTFTQSGGSSSLGDLQLGVATNSTGVVSLTAGTLTASTTVVGEGGSGTFIQNGTLALSNLGGLAIGDGGAGTVLLQAGSLTASSTSVGLFNGPGTLSQSGGSSSLGDFYVGEFSPGYASLSGGTLNASFALLGDLGTGTLIQNGSTSFANVGSLYIGAAASGVLNLSAGTLTASSTTVGDGGIGTFLQSGSLSISNLGTLLLGDGTGSTGTVMLSGGSLTANTAPFSTGAIVGDGGTGLFIQSGGSSNLGNVTVAYGSTSLGTVSLTAGTLTTNSIVVGQGGSGTFIQNGGVSSLGGVTVGYSGAGTLLLQAGSLTAGATIVGFGGGATFSQSGGSSSLGDFYVGDSSPGYASLSGGTLVASFTVVGDSATGTFIQNGSTSFANVGSLYIGASASGTLNLSAGTLNAVSTIVGEATAGTFTQSGGTSSLGALAVGSIGYLSVTSSTASASVGTIAADGTLTVANGTFSVPGGTLTNSGFIEASGTFSNILTGTLSNSGTVSANASVASFGGSLTNNPGSTFGVYGLAIFDGPVVGAGAFTGSGTLDFISVLNSTQPLVFGGTAVVGLSSTANVPTVQVRNLQVAGTLNFAGSGTAGTGSISSLLISSGGRLNLNTNGLVIEYGNGTSPVGDLSFARTARNYPAGSIQSYAQTAFNGFAWNGPGISSSYAANDPNGLTAVGIADENDLGDVYPGDYTVADGGPGTWMGQPINDTNNVLVRMTYYGDGNLDGVVNRLDVTALSQGYSGLAGYVGWSDGDYTYSGDITKVDVSLLAQSYLFQGAPLGDAITSGQAQYLLALDPDMSPAAKADFQTIAGTPEPASVTLIALAGAGLLRRRRR